MYDSPSTYDKVVGGRKRDTRDASNPSKDAQCIYTYIYIMEYKLQYMDDGIHITELHQGIYNILHNI